MKRLRKGSLTLIGGIGRSREGPNAHKWAVNITTQANLTEINAANSLELVCSQHFKTCDWLESPV